MCQHVKGSYGKCLIILSPRSAQTTQKRLQLVDWAAAVHGAATGEHEVTNIGPALFVDDSRYTVSSAPAAITVTVKHNQYSTETGVMFETKQDSNSTAPVRPGSETPVDIRQMLKGTLLGGSPQTGQQREVPWSTRGS